ncbi:hypothetical protein XBKQ1_2600004 [Xenorhabdus bovienii str. kraussei Quebec]|uniref:Uncharacterized protein n=1 Tax=Xenorhabdus bovienii str. kraussei Quebec TaxID=1398203 RepID=A0A077PI46_XENBV|nr:hypothetical protein [Xenorhabdus bovienii]CDH20322.1 hypothetical protein XBKQ1_2600004 [Xenorhabdus bovienii str. kraussei Quebec]
MSSRNLLNLLNSIYGTEPSCINSNDLIEGDELQSLKKVPDNIGLVSKHTINLILWTERGAANYSKMLDQLYQLKKDDSDLSHHKNQELVVAKGLLRISTA